MQDWHGNRFALRNAATLGAEFREIAAACVTLMATLGRQAEERGVGDCLLAARRDLRVTVKWPPEHPM